MTEKDGNLRTLFRNYLPKFHWQTIETGLLGRGVPDSEYCYCGQSGWVEFKQTEAWAVDLDPEQVGWILRRRRAGGRAMIAVRQRCVAGPRRAARDLLWLVRGDYARELKDYGLKCDARAVLGAWPGGPVNWPWIEVAHHLTAPV